MDIVGYCLERSSRWEWALTVVEDIESGVVAEPAELGELLVLPTALLPPDPVPGLRLDVDMEMLLPLLLRVPTSLPSPSDPGKVRSSSTTSNAAPGFITRVISSKRSSHYSVLA